LALAVQPNEACYVPLAHRQAGGDGALFRPDPLPDQIPINAALDALRPLLEDASVLKIGYDLKFAWLVLALHGVEITPADDVLLLSYVLDAGKGSHEMEPLAARLLEFT